VSLLFKWIEEVKKPHTEEAPKLTSLYPYYATLPQFIRDHHSVKLTYKALEFHKHTMDIEEKEKALNFVAYSALDMDESTYTSLSS
jgi:hypothetical protein